MLDLFLCDLDALLALLRRSSLPSRPPPPDPDPDPGPGAGMSLVSVKELVAAVS